MDKNDKLHIVDSAEGSTVPFLRGILTRSLQKAGLTFDQAYKMASSIRKELGDEHTVSNLYLRKVVVKHLEKRGFNSCIEDYLSQSIEAPQIRVLTSDGSDAPFSKGQLSDSLQICGLPKEEIYRIAAAIEGELIAAERQEVTTEEITDRVFDLLEKYAGLDISNAYRRWVAFSHTGRPLIILVGGANGSGKSSISSELAHRLDIVRTQSTDMLREVMRLLAPERLVPTLHTSSFEAYTQMPTVSDTYKTEEMITGYLTQSRQVGVGVEGVLNRTCNERVSVIIEGVHLHPQLMERISRETDALVVPIILAVLRAKRLKKRLVGRGQVISSRRSERYLESFNKIWDLQSFLVSQADEYNIPIVANDNEDDTLREIMQTISEYLEKATTQKN
ncbi:hypothetical protein HQ496_05235 [bacterium]|nr:hypothetical protein [bacterium]